MRVKRNNICARPDTVNNRLNERSFLSSLYSVLRELKHMLLHAIVFLLLLSRQGFFCFCFNPREVVSVVPAFNPPSVISSLQGRKTEERCYPCGFLCLEKGQRGHSYLWVLISASLVQLFGFVCGENQAGGERDQHKQ